MTDNPQDALTNDDFPLLRLLARELRPSLTLAYWNPADQGSDYLDVLDEASVLLKLLRAGRLHCSNCGHWGLSSIRHLADLADGPESGTCGCLWVECGHEVEGDEPRCLDCQPWTEDELDEMTEPF